MNEFPIHVLAANQTDAQKAEDYRTRLKPDQTDDIESLNQ